MGMGNGNGEGRGRREGLNGTEIYGENIRFPFI